MRRKALWFYFILVFAWIWAVAGFLFLFPSQAAAIFGPMSSANLLFILAVWGPNIIALGLTAALYGSRGVVDLLKKFTVWKVNPLWYVLILLVLPAVGLASALLAGAFSTSLLGRWDASTPSRLAGVLFNLVITGALGEELGWRGFALPRLLQKWSPLVSSLILGAIWGFWHLPGFLASGTPQNGLSLPAFVLGAITLSILVTWVYIHTHGSLLMPALIHFMANFSLNVLGAPMPVFSVLLLAMILIVILSRSASWLARPTSPIVYQAEPVPPEESSL